MHTVDHVLFLTKWSHTCCITNWYSKFNATLTMLCSQVYIVRFLFCPLHVSVLKAPTIFAVNAALPLNVRNAVSSINLTHCFCKGCQCTYTIVVNNPCKHLLFVPLKYYRFSSTRYKFNMFLFTFTFFFAFV